MSDPLYRKEVLRLAADAVGAGRLERADVRGMAHNPSCGDKATVELNLADGRVSAIAHDTKACVLSQASASILGTHLTGKSHGDIETLLEQVRGLLNGGSPPPAPFGDYAVFDGVAGFKNRHRCVTLPIEAALKAFENSEADKDQGIGAKV
jgi:NifU-like protein involved in Fe-S cluster formation